MRLILAVVALTLGACAHANDQSHDWAREQPSWVAPVEPFQIIGNLYYVGTEGLAVYLLTGRDGHALIDGGLAGYEQLIIDNVAALGFAITDVRYLFVTHAHFDHSGGLAALKAASGAELWASKGDVAALEGGYYEGSEDVARYHAPPVRVDHVIDDRAEGFSGAAFSFAAEAGAQAQLRTSLTPGHTRGCTSFRLSLAEGDEHLEAVIFCSASVAANRLVAREGKPAQYDGIVDDYRMTFETTKDWAPDIFLSNHTDVFDMKSCRAETIAGNSRAFVNRGAFQEYRRGAIAAFEKALEKQIAAGDDE